MVFWGNLSQKEKVGLVIGGIFICFALIDRTVIGPINAKIHQIDRQISLSHRELGIQLRNVSQKRSLREQYDKYVQRTTESGSDEERIASMLTTVEDLSRDAGVVLRDIKPQPTKALERFKQYNIAIEAEAPMGPLINFLYKLNRSSELLRVESLLLTLKDKDSNIVKASIAISKIVIP